MPNNPGAIAVQAESRAAWHGSASPPAPTGLLSGTWLETLLILFYLLVFGETFLLRMVEILPRFRDKREAVEISPTTWSSDMSAYMLTITVINAVVGVITGCIMWAFGVPGAPCCGVSWHSA